MEFKLAAIFSDNCVLQREKNIVLFGTGQEGQLVEAVISGRTLGSTVDQESRGCAHVRGGRF